MSRLYYLVAKINQVIRLTSKLILDVIYFEENYKIVGLNGLNPIDKTLNELEAELLLVKAIINKIRTEG